MTSASFLRLVVVLLYSGLVLRVSWLLYHNHVSKYKTLSLHIIGILAGVWSIFYIYLSFSFWGTADSTDPHVLFASNMSRMGHVVTAIMLYLLTYLIEVAAKVKNAQIDKMVEILYGEDRYARDAIRKYNGD